MIAAKIGEGAPPPAPPGAPGRGSSSVVAAALAIFRKDVISEWRTRVALNALFLFALSVLVLVGFALGPTSLVREDRPIVNAVLLWIVLFFSAMTGLPRAFVKEEETGTAAALRMTAPGPAVFLGKLLLNAALLGVLSLFAVPLFLALMSFEIQGVPLFLALLVLGGFGLASASTFIAAIVAKASAKSALFAVLATPLLLPPLVAAVSGTRVAATDPSFAAGIEFVKLLVAYDGVVTTAAFLLFDAVFRE